MQKIAHFLKRFIYSAVYSLSMGLEGILSEEEWKDFREIAGFTSPNLYDVYPDDFGRINCKRGFLRSFFHSKEVTTKLRFSLFPKWSAVKTVTNELHKFKDLYHLLYQIKNTEGVPNRIGNLRNHPRFSSQCGAFYSHVLDYFSGRENFQTLDSLFNGEGARELASMFKKSGFKESVEQFKQNLDPVMYSRARSFMRDLIGIVGGSPLDGKWGDEELLLRGVIEHSSCIFCKYSNGEIDIGELTELYVSENTKVREQINLIKEDYYYDDEDFPPVSWTAWCSNFMEGPANGFSLFREICEFQYSLIKEEEKHVDRTGSKSTFFASLNAERAEGILINSIGACISGPAGKSREAAILHYLDDAVHLWTINASPASVEGKRQYAIGLGIFVEATGGHHSNPGAKEKYLVLEGFVANPDYYSEIAFIKPDKYDDAGFPPIEHLSLPNLMYMCGLATARFLGIKRLFINTEHTGKSRSVEEVVHTAAIEAGLSTDVWRFRKGGFKLVADQYTCSDFAQVKAADSTFEYTHYLEKAPLSPELVKQLRRDSNWNGEEFFDTFYGWNKFIMETYSNWTEELKKQYPYAESVWKRGKDSQWNLGIGYCKGFEVDVKNECDRLGIKEHAPARSSNSIAIIGDAEDFLIRKQLGL